MRYLVLLILVFGLTAPSFAQYGVWDDDGPSSLTLLSGDSLRAAFSGRTMDGTYKQFRQRSGTVHFTETFTKDGKTIYREGKVHDTGIWVIPRDDVICFRYDGPLSGGVSCFTVFREGTCLYSYNPARIKDGKPIDNNQWSAKTVIRGELSTCSDMVG